MSENDLEPRHPFGDEIAELELALPTVQAEALVEAAQERGLTAAQMIRRLIQEFLQRGHAPTRVGRMIHQPA